MLDSELPQYLLSTYGEILLGGAYYTPIKKDTTLLTYIRNGGRPDYRAPTLEEKVSTFLEWQNTFENVQHITWVIVRRMLESPDKFMSRSESGEGKDLEEGEIRIQDPKDLDYLIDVDTEVVFEYTTLCSVPEISYIHPSICGHTQVFHHNLESPRCFNVAEKFLLQNCMRSIVKDKQQRCQTDQAEAQRKEDEKERNLLISKYKK